MIIAGKYEVPDDCPKDCKFTGCISQGDWCHQCPVFNCAPTEDEDGGEFYLCRPEDYREDWAAEWEEFFKTGKTPELAL